jgi:hypothetical protein
VLAARPSHCARSLRRLPRFLVLTAQLPNVFNCSGAIQSQKYQISTWTTHSNVHCLYTRLSLRNELVSSVFWYLVVLVIYFNMLLSLSLRKWNSPPRDKENYKRAFFFSSKSFKLELCKLQKPVVFCFALHGTTFVSLVSVRVTYFQWRA